MNKLCGLLLAFMLCGLASAQTSQIPPNSGDRTFSSIFFPVYTLNAAPVSGASLATVGQTGQANWCYWAVANFQIGSVMSSLGCIPNSANTLTSSNYNSILPFAYPPSVTSIDILATTSFSAPTGACACAVATGLTSGGTNQQSNTTSAYTVSLLNPQAFNLVLRNEVVGSASTHLLLRNAYTGALVCDVSTACGASGGSVTGSGTNGTIPIWTGASSLGNSGITFATSTYFFANGVSITGNESMSGRIQNYNGDSTVANGVTSNVGLQTTNALTGNLSPTTIYTVPALGTQLYRANCYLVIQTAGGSSSTLPSCQISWTDATTGVVETATFSTTSTANTIGTYGSGSIVISPNNATTVTVSTTGYLSGGSNMGYVGQFVLEKM